MDIVEHLAAAAAIAADDVAMAVFAYERKVVARYHGAIADEHHALEPKALLKMIQHLGHCLAIAPIAVEDEVRDRPTIDHDQHPEVCFASQRSCIFVQFFPPGKIRP